MHGLFRVALAVKAVDGGAQLLGGLVLAIIPTTVLTGLANDLLTRDLVGNHDGTLAHHLATAIRDFGNPGTRVFAVVFLLLHGMVKLGLVAALYRQVRPAYPVAVLILTAFVVYELIRAAHTGSIALPFFAALDLITIALVLREYRDLRKRSPQRNLPTG
ncbi:DUF2127 domain-containing protein [Actinokineospora cianjurensis]|uniref:Putative membrane protein n=1 Tax=Actinokineospora cianjurensis TaxID=585224 RepID=A0A421AVW6_9PSEU|nr:DUF2127 domain-containing protein [Actinokineospora cianjurensis]RLK54201.1 putative membrane protein [Actinokineospora cianjurensis]